MNDNLNHENAQNENIEQNGNNNENIEQNTTQNENQQMSVENSQQESNQQDTQEKKKTAADLILERLKARKENTDSSDNVKELQKIEEVVKKEAEPDTVEHEDEPEEKEESEKEKMPNYNEFDRKQLVEELKKLLDLPFEKIGKKAEIIKDTFYKKRNAEIAEKKQKFIDDGGDPKDFKHENDEIDNEFSEVFDKYKEIKKAHREQLEAELQRNLEAKNSIIEKIEELINKGETLNKTFEEFHKLREEWNNIGAVPANMAKNLLEKYNFTLQKFYDWVKINKELRDLDLKKNLEQKIKLCEEAEALIIEPKITKAYAKLQKLHEKWREIGPVPKDKKEEIWNRFKEASSIINKKHYDYFQNIKEQQLGNLKAKELLCEEAEKIANQDYTKPKEWRDKTDEINELMKLWRLIGFAPKKYNNQIFERFIAARKKFFEKKQEFFQNYTEILEKNQQLKEELIVEAETAKDNTDWKKTTKFFVDLQNKWKEIGPVPNAVKDQLWEKFNSACNYFFEKKREFFKNRKEEEEKNLELKKQLIEKIKNFEPTNNPDEDLKKLQEFQKEWSEIGFVPFKEKDNIYKEYKAAIDEKFKNLAIDKNLKKELELKQKIEKLLKSNNALNKIRHEIEKTKNHIANLTSEIVTLENNLSFFVKSKNSESILENFRKKIDRLKDQRTKQEEALKELTKAYKEAQKK